MATLKKIATKAIRKVGSASASRATHPVPLCAGYGFRFRSASGHEGSLNAFIGSILGFLAQHYSHYSHFCTALALYILTHAAITLRNFILVKAQGSSILDALLLTATNSFKPRNVLSVMAINGE